MLIDIKSKILSFKFEPSYTCTHTEIHLISTLYWCKCVLTCRGMFHESDKSEKLHLTGNQSNQFDEFIPYIPQVPVISNQKSNIFYLTFFLTKYFWNHSILTIVHKSYLFYTWNSFLMKEKFKLRCFWMNLNVVDFNFSYVQDVWVTLKKIGTSYHYSPWSHTYRLFINELSFKDFSRIRCTPKMNDIFNNKSFLAKVGVIRSILSNNRKKIGSPASRNISQKKIKVCCFHLPIKLNFVQIHQKYYLRNNNGQILSLFPTVNWRALCCSLYFVLYGVRVFQLLPL